MKKKSYSASHKSLDTQASDFLSTSIVPPSLLVNKKILFRRHAPFPDSVPLRCAGVIALPVSNTGLDSETAVEEKLEVRQVAVSLCLQF